MDRPPTNPFRLLPRRASRGEALERAVLTHTYGLMPTSMFGVAITAWAFAFGAIDTLYDRRLVVWMTVQSLVLVVNLAVLHAYRSGRTADSTRTALNLHRFGVLLAGAAWGLAGVLWPIRADLGPEFALLFCYAGMCAGGATTLAGDPVSYALFGTSALLPYFVQSIPTLWWVAALLGAFVTITSTTVMWNERTLRESLALRFENVDLLKRAISDREAAVAAHTEAERAARAKTRFLAAASHDLRQPVQALSLFVDVLARDPDLDSEQRGRAIESLGRTTDALRAMLEGLLDVSRLDAGVIASKPTTILLAPLLDEIVAALRDESEANDMVVHAMGRPCTVYADPVLLSRVLHNLAGNAVRHGGRGRVLIAVRRRGDRAIVQVWDQGEGIAPADRERIFEEFVQLENDERDRRRGLGLGLPIVRRICEQNDWSLTLQSNPGRGSTFAINLPIAASAHAEREEAGSSRVSRGIRVLLVDDDALVATASTMFLQANGYVVDAARSADEAWARLEQLDRAGTPPDVLITDFRLPGATSGVDLLQRIDATRTLGPLPAILLTGDVTEDPPSDTRPPSGLVVLGKPVDGSTLLRAVDRLVAVDRPKPAGPSLRSP